MARPQLPHGMVSAVPHAPQKLFAGGFMDPHDGQDMIRVQIAILATAAPSVALESVEIKPSVR
ncbi:MAG: hypothetical protein IT305_03840 [Chloroflexi bacterium]|nr:hypothetical protein [Chloroflexota bacterium]